MRFIAGVILGIMIATVGFSGIAQMFDGVVHKIQLVAKDTAAAGK
jgi:hypothetical protein